MSATRRKMAIFIDFKFEDLEVMYPKIRLEEEGVIVHVIGSHAKGMKCTRRISVYSLVLFSLLSGTTTHTKPHVQIRENLDIPSKVI